MVISMQSYFQEVIGQNFFLAFNPLDLRHFVTGILMKSCICYGIVEF